MTQNALLQIVLLAIETLGIGALLLVFFRLRIHFGLALLYVTLGSFQQLQTALAGTLSMELFPGLSISPGSVVLFTATLFALLLVYIREDAAEARALVYGIVLTNIFIGIIVGFFGLQFATQTGPINPAFEVDKLLSSARLFFSGTAILALDVVLLIVLYEFFSRIFERSAYLRVFSTLVVVLAFDTVAFTTSAFYPTNEFANLILSGFIGKTFVAAILAFLMAYYLRKFDKPEDHDGPLADQVRGIFGVMTYRQRYTVLRERYQRDPMTGLYNRGFFDANFQKEVDRAVRLGHDASLMLIDLDHFKAINDSRGHTFGDQVIVAMAEAMKRSFRNADLPCRFGGEEFAVIMPDTERAAAVMLANRLRDNFKLEVQTLATSDEPLSVTMTIGVATFHEDAKDAFDLLEVADQRMYAGKEAGRDRVVADD